MKEALIAFLYWVISLTWGLFMTLIGLLAALALLVTGHKPHKFGYTFYFKVGQRWGGLNLGAVFITDNTPSEHTLCHEHGHGLQNCIFGVLFPFLIGIPSAFRYWYREIKRKQDPSCYLPPYDSIWFEGQATRLGLKFLGRYGK